MVKYEVEFRRVIKSNLPRAEHEAYCRRGGSKDELSLEV